MMKNMKIPGKGTLLLFLSCLFFCGGMIADLSALEPGKGLPRLRAEKWYSGEKNKDARLQAVVLMDLTSSDAQALLQMLESMKLSSSGKDLAVTVFVMNQQKIADSVMKELGKFDFRIGLDNNLKMRNLLAEHISLFPYALLADKGTVIWGGMPTELESIVKKVLAGKFSAEKQRRVEGLRKELQIAIQSGLPVVVSATADKILAIIPDDRLAIQSKLFAMDAMRQKDAAVKFIEEICRKNPEEIQFAVMLLDYLIREGRWEKIVPAAEKTFEKYKNNSDAVLLTAYILENIPFGLLLPSRQIAMTSEVWAKCKKDSRKNRKVLAAEMYAKALSMAGRFEEAVKLQKEALLLRKGDNMEQAAKDRLAYYMDALAASGKSQKVNEKILKEKK